jgi:hypothetical protein
VTKVAEKLQKHSKAAAINLKIAHGLEDVFHSFPYDRKYNL